MRWLLLVLLSLVNTGALVWIMWRKERTAPQVVQLALQNEAMRRSELKAWKDQAQAATELIFRINAVQAGKDTHVPLDPESIYADEPSPRGAEAGD